MARIPRNTRPPNGKDDFPNISTETEEAITNILRPYHSAPELKATIKALDALAYEINPDNKNTADPILVQEVAVEGTIRVYLPAHISNIAGIEVDVDGQMLYAGTDFTLENPETVLLSRPLTAGQKIQVRYQRTLPLGDVSIGQVINLQEALDSKIDKGAALPAHSHSIYDVDGLIDALDGKQPAGAYASLTHTHTLENVTGLPAALASKAEASHTHTQAQVVGLTAALDAKSNVGHTHTMSEVAGLDAALNNKAPATHTHSADDITSGTLPITRGGTGATSASAARTALGAAAASHTHTIANVTGLQDALDAKQAAGNYAAATHTHSIADVTGLQAELDGKLTNIVAGTNVYIDYSNPKQPVISASGGSEGGVSLPIAITDVTGLQSALDGTVKTTGAQTISGAKTFTSNSVFQGSVTVPNGMLYSASAGVLGVRYTGSDSAHSYVQFNGNTKNLEVLNGTVTIGSNKYPVWHSGNFDPSSKAAADHTHSVVNMTDVQVTSPTNGQVLKYDSSISKFTNQADSNTTYSVPALTELQTGTATTSRVITAARLKEWADWRFATATLTGYVSSTADETVGGTKTFTTAPKVVQATGGARLVMPPIQTAGNELALHYNGNGEAGFYDNTAANWRFKVGADGVVSPAHIPSIPMSKVELLSAEFGKYVNKTGINQVFGDFRLSQVTASGADTGSIRLVSGGGFDRDRGAILEVNGASAATNPGIFRLLGTGESQIQSDSIKITGPVYNLGDVHIGKVSARLTLGVNPTVVSGGVVNYGNSGIYDVGLAANGTGKVRLRPSGFSSTDGEVIVMSASFTFNGNDVWHAGNFTPTNIPTQTGDLWIAKSAPNIYLRNAANDTVMGRLGHNNTNLYIGSEVGDIYLRPAGYSSSAGQVVINSTNGMTIAGKKVLTEGQAITDQYGINGAIPTGADLNTYTTTGFYHQSSTANATAGTNYPANWAGMLFVYAASVMVYQTYHQFGSSRRWHRSSYNGVWSAWEEESHVGHTHSEYAAVGHTHSEYAAASHNHSASNITSGTLAIARGGTGATTAAAALTSLGAAAASHTHSEYAATNHTHSEYAVVGHTHSEYAAASHNHSAANITSGTLAIARGGTGATTAAAALTALGAAAASHTHSEYADDSAVVKLTGNQSVAGTKTFTGVVQANARIKVGDANAATNRRDQPRVFVQSADPDAAAADGDLWIW